jgi:hypothetical protein
MNRYLIVFINEGQFYVESLQASTLAQAVEMFYKSVPLFDEVYSVTRVA